MADPVLVLDRSVVEAHLVCLCADPRRADEGEWHLLLEDAQLKPVAFVPVELVFDSQHPPITAAEAMLRRAGYELARTIVAKPWAASWKIVRPDALSAP